MARIPDPLGGRSIEEWIGKTPDSMPPPRVELRIWNRAGGRCQICSRKLAGETWHSDHIVALGDGGRNAESNFQVACEWCHGRKTGAENTARAGVRSKARKHAGIKKRASRPMPGSKASKWKRTVGGQVVLRRTSEDHDGR